MKVFLIGFMGCGKTHWGKLLSEKLKIPFFDLDSKIAEQEDQSIAEIFEQKGEEYFRLMERDVLQLITESHDSFIMATGGGTPCFYNNIDYLKKKGLVVWLNCATNTLHARLKKEKTSRPLISEKGDDELREFIVRKYSSRKIYYQQANLILQDEQITLEELVRRIFKERS